MGQALNTVCYHLHLLQHLFPSFHITVPWCFHPSPVSNASSFLYRVSTWHSFFAVPIPSVFPLYCSEFLLWFHASFMVCNNLLSFSFFHSIRTLLHFHESSRLLFLCRTSVWLDGSKSFVGTGYNSFPWYSMSIPYMACKNVPSFHFLLLSLCSLIFLLRLLHCTSEARSPRCVVGEKGV